MCVCVAVGGGVGLLISSESALGRLFIFKEVFFFL